MSAPSCVRPTRRRPPIVSRRDARLPQLPDIGLLPRTVQISCTAIDWYRQTPLGLEHGVLLERAAIELLMEHAPQRLDAASARSVALRLSERLLAALAVVAETVDDSSHAAAVDARAHALACRLALRADGGVS